MEKEKRGRWEASFFMYHTTQNAGLPIDPGLRFSRYLKTPNRNVTLTFQLRKIGFFFSLFSDR